MSTKTLLLKIAVIIFIFSILFSSCTIVTTSQINGTDIADLDVFIVQYKTDIGTAPKMRGIVKDANFKAEWVPELSQDGYKFLGWYSGEQKISAGHICTSDLKAKMVKINQPREKPLKEIKNTLQQECASGTQ